MPETDYHRVVRMPIPMPDPREQRVVDPYPETEGTRAAAKAQQRIDRAECIKEADDPERSIDGRLLFDLLCEEFGADRLHRWSRNAVLIRGGACPCERVERDR